MSHNKEEDKLKTLLKSMPKIEDHQTKDELYSKISSRLENKETPSIKKRRFTWVFPSIGTVGVLILLFLVFQNSPIDFNGNYETSNYDTAGNAGDHSADQSINNFSEESVPEIEALEESADGEVGMTKFAPSSHIVSDVAPDTMLVQLAVTEPDLQWVIPITITERNLNRDINQYYNQMERFINVQELGVKPLLTNGLSFDISEAENQVTLHVSEDFKFPEGSSYANIFEKSLSYMFSNYPIEHVELESTVESDNLFGALGVENNQIQLFDYSNFAYKMYQRSEGYPEFLVPIYENFTSLEEALLEMTKDEPDYNVSATIPADITFHIEADNDTAIVRFGESDVFGDPQQTLNMIESILMTAKSFGFKEVKFELPILNVGPYQFEDPIPVPVGVNPIEVRRVTNE